MIITVTKATAPKSSGLNDEAEQLETPRENRALVAVAPVSKTTRETSATYRPAVFLAQLIAN
jgi:hypothetical protein